MLPNYSPPLTKKMIRIKVPASLAEKLKAAEALTVTETLPGAKGEESSPPLSLFKKGDEPSSSSSSSSSSSDTPASGSADAAAPAALASTSDAGAGSSDEASSSGSGGDEEMVDVEREVSVRGEQGSLAAALYRKQLEKSINNGARFLGWPLEGALLLTLHFAEEMLYRAVALTWAVGWTIDRLYEAGADETVGLGAASLATPQLGAALALAGCTTVSLGLLVQREFFPLKMLDKAQRDLSGGEGTAAEKERMARVLAKVKAGIRKQRLWSVSIEAVRDASEWACYGGAFLLTGRLEKLWVWLCVVCTPHPFIPSARLPCYCMDLNARCSPAPPFSPPTGNLLAPYLAAVVSDVAFSIYQRMRQTEVDKAQERASKQIGELRAVAKDMGAAKRSRVDRLQPPPLPRAPRPEEQPAEGSGSRPAEEEDKPGA